MATNLKVSEIVQRLREGVDPDDIQGTEAAMDAAADYIEALQATAVLFAREAGR
jgi:hypothetical protein